MDDRKCNLNQKWNKDKCPCECKKLKEYLTCGKNCIANPITCCCKNGKYLTSIIDDSVIRCDQIIEITKAIPTKTTSTKTVPINI